MDGRTTKLSLLITTLNSAALMSLMTAAEQHLSSAQLIRVLVEPAALRPAYRAGTPFHSCRIINPVI